MKITKPRSLGCVWEHDWYYDFVEHPRDQIYRYRQCLRCGVQQRKVRDWNAKWKAIRFTNQVRHAGK